MKDPVTLRKIWNKSEPQPFPGRWPTRISWFVRFTDKKAVGYFGKPSRNSVQQFFKLVKQPTVSTLGFKELDRGGLIAFWTTLGPFRWGEEGEPHIAPTRYESAYCIYHAFDLVRNFMYYELATPFLRKKVWAVKLDGYWVYAHRENPTPAERLMFEKHIAMTYPLKEKEHKKAGPVFRRVFLNH